MEIAIDGFPDRRSLASRDDVAAKLEAARRKSGPSFKETVNYYLRRGLTAREKPKKKPFVIRDIGFRLGVEFDSGAELIERLEGPGHK